MKIDLDLSDIYEDEDGHRLSGEFTDRVVSALVYKMQGEVTKEIREQVNQKITKVISDSIEAEMPKILGGFLDYEFEEVTSWGEKKGKWTVRDRMASAIKEATGFKREDFWSNGKETPFTKLLAKEIEVQLKPLTQELRAVMNSEFKAECIKEASTHLIEKFKDVK